MGIPEHEFEENIEKPLVKRNYSLESAMNQFSRRTEYRKKMELTIFEDFESIPPEQYADKYAALHEFREWKNRFLINVSPDAAEEAKSIYELGPRLKDGLITRREKQISRGTRPAAPT